MTVLESWKFAAYFSFKLQIASIYCWYFLSGYKPLVLFSSCLEEINVWKGKKYCCKSVRAVDVYQLLLLGLFILKLKKEKTLVESLNFPDCLEEWICKHYLTVPRCGKLKLLLLNFKEQK